MGLTPLQIAGWQGQPEAMEWLLTLNPDVEHVNHYGGGLISTILHGSENCPERHERDYETCLRLALQAGAPATRAEAEHAGQEELAGMIADWLDDREGAAAS